jgi:carbamate kinase
VATPAADRVLRSGVRPGAVVALDGNAIARPERTDPEFRRAAVEEATEPVAELVVDRYEVVLTHGNGPQVSNLLLTNELARDVFPGVPLDWCVAQTQATIGYLIATALDGALAARGSRVPVICILSRVRVDAGDPRFAAPSKPIGHPSGGSRRLVPSPEPREMLDSDGALHLLDNGAVVVAGSGGGTPMVRAEHRGLEGVEAVLDKHLWAALLARRVPAELLVIATDGEGAAVDFGTRDERWLGRVSASCASWPPPGTSRTGAWGRRWRPACAPSRQAGVAR